jgi:hypothetical protein
VLPFPAPSLPRQKIFPAQSRKFPALANRENFARTLKALRNLWVLFMKLPEKISNTLQISLRAGNLKAGDRFAPDCLVTLMLFHDAVHMAVDGAGAKLVPVGRRTDTRRSPPIRT